MGDRIATKGEGGAEADPLSLLREKLLAAGGKELDEGDLPPPEVAALLARGRFFDLPVYRHRGERYRCHSNAAQIWGRYLGSENGAFHLVGGCP